MGKCHQYYAFQTPGPPPKGPCVPSVPAIPGDSKNASLVCAPPWSITSTDTALSALLLPGASRPLVGLLLFGVRGAPSAGPLSSWRFSGGLGGGISKSKPLLKSVSAATFLGDWFRRLLGGGHTPSSTCLGLGELEAASERW